MVRLLFPALSAAAVTTTALSLFPLVTYAFQQLPSGRFRSSLVRLHSSRAEEILARVNQAGVKEPENIPVLFEDDLLDDMQQALLILERRVKEGPGSLGRLDVHVLSEQLHRIAVEMKNPAIAKPPRPERVQESAPPPPPPPAVSGDGNPPPITASAFDLEARVQAQEQQEPPPPPPPVAAESANPPPITKASFDPDAPQAATQEDPNATPPDNANPPPITAAAFKPPAAPVAPPPPSPPAPAPGAPAVASTAKSALSYLDDDETPAYEPGTGMGQPKGTRNTYIIPGMDEMDGEEYRDALQQSVIDRIEARRRAGGPLGNRASNGYLSQLNGDGPSVPAPQSEMELLDPSNPIYQQNNEDRPKREKGWASPKAGKY